MNNYLHTISRPDTIRLGWALIHFLWQGLGIAFLLEIALGLVGRKNASLRYLLCGLALAIMPVCLVDTYLAMSRDSYAIPAQSPLVAQTVSATPPSQDMPAIVTFMPVIRTITEFTSHENKSFDLNRCMPGIVALWLVGVLFLTGRKAGGFIVLWRLRRHGVSTPGDTITGLFQQACAKIGIDPQRACLKISTLVQVPMTMGWVRPIVLFPAALLSGLSAGEIELLLAHELAHIRRCDYLVNLFQTMVETLFFYHPVTWWISRRMRQERENSCDDLVAACSVEPLSYAKVLLRLESIRSPGEWLASAANGGSLLQRIQRLIGESAPSSGMGLPSLFMLMSVFGIIAAVSIGEAQTPNQAATAPKVATSDKVQTPGNNGPGKTLQQQYLDLYEKLNHAHYLEKEGKAPEALGGYRDCLSTLQVMQASNPNWEKGLIASRIQDCQTKITELSQPGAAISQSAFAQPVTMKEEKKQEYGLTLRSYYQGKNLVLLYQERNANPGNIEQTVFYKNTIIVDQISEARPVPFSSRSVSPNNFKIKIESIAADTFGPERLRVSDSESHEIFMELFIDKAGIMRPVTKAEHDADIARHVASSSAPEVNLPASLTKEEAKAQSIAAVVNGHPISEASVEMQSMSAEFALKKANPSENELHEKIAEVRKNALSDLIDRQLIIDDFEAQGEHLPKSYANDMIDRLIKDHGGDRNEYLAGLAERHQTLEMVKWQIEETASLGLMRSKNVWRNIIKYYQDHLDLFPQDEQVNVTLIMIDTPGTPPPDHNQKPYLLAQQVLEQVRQGADFSALAQKYANYDNHPLGPTLWMTGDGLGTLPIPPLWQALQKLQPGQTSGIIDLTYYGFYGIVRVNERRPARIASTEETTKQKLALIDAEKKKIEQAWLAPLRAKAKIQVFSQE